MSRIGTAAAEHLDTCIRCGDDTLKAEGERLRHGIKISDHPDDEKTNSMWGNLCPECWRPVWMYIAGKKPERYGEPIKSTDVEFRVRRQVESRT